MHSESTTVIGLFDPQYLYEGDEDVIIAVVIAI